MTMREGWEQTTLGEALLVNPKMGKLPDSAPFVTMSDVSEWGGHAYPSGEKGSRGGIRAQGGDVLFARITPCLENGKIGKLPRSAPPTGGSTEFIVLRGSEKATSDFAFLLAQSRHVHSSAVSLMTGSTGRQRVAASDVARIPIALPPLREQRRIVDLMGSVDAAISAAQKEVDAATALRTAVLEHELGDTGTGWHLTTLGEALQVNPKMPKLPASAPFVTMADIEEWGSYAYPSGEKGTRGGVRAQGGDVLFARITPCLENGKIGRLPLAAPPTGGSTEFIVLRASDEVTPDFAFLLAQSAHVHSSAVALMTGSTGRQRVAAADVARIAVVIPPLHEQQRIVDTMTTLDSSVSAAESALDRLREFRSSMLTVLLSGEHEIPESYDRFLTETGEAQGRHV